MQLLNTGYIPATEVAAVCPVAFLTKSHVKVKWWYTIDVHHILLLIFNSNDSKTIFMNNFITFLVTHNWMLLLFLMHILNLIQLKVQIYLYLYIWRNSWIIISKKIIIAASLYQKEKSCIHTHWIGILIIHIKYWQSIFLALITWICSIFF